MSYLTELCTIAKKASVNLSALGDIETSTALISVAEALVKNSEYIIAENLKDLNEAALRNYPSSLMDRLKLTKERVIQMSEGVRQVAALKSPVGETVYSFTGQDGLDVKQIKVPFGVIGIIYESRPNVTADAFALCFRTHNAVILRGGSDAINSNKAIVKVIKESLASSNVDKNAVNLIEDTSRETVTEFIKLNGYVDLLIPRGGAGLINSVKQNATVPVIETGVGNCHIYVDESADLDMAANIIFNAKTQRYGVCNACESIVIHSAVVKPALEKIKNRLDEKQVEIRADERARQAVPQVCLATEQDFATEYLNPIISVKTVDSVEQAIEHINKYGTGHSEAIITENKQNAEKFMREVDASTVYHNASTRFTDGFQFGMGAEIGISTQKLHARGPMGLNALTTTKFIVEGNGQVRK